MPSTWCWLRWSTVVLLHLASHSLVGWITFLTTWLLQNSIAGEPGLGCGTPITSLLTRSIGESKSRSSPGSGGVEIDAAFWYKELQRCVAIFTIAHRLLSPVPQTTASPALSHTPNLCNSLSELCAVPRISYTFRSIPFYLLLLLLDYLAEDSSTVTLSGLLYWISEFGLVVYQLGCHLLRLNIKLWLKVPQTVGQFIISYVKKCINAAALGLFDAVTYVSLNTQLLFGSYFCLTVAPLMITTWLLWFRMLQPDTAVFEARKSQSPLTYFYFHNVPQPTSSQVFWFVMSSFACT